MITPDAPAAPEGRHGDPPGRVAGDAAGELPPGGGGHRQLRRRPPRPRRARRRAAPPRRRRRRPRRRPHLRPPPAATAPPPPTTLADRGRWLHDLGADHVLVLHTTPDLLALSAEAFFAEVIRKRLAA